MSAAEDQTITPFHGSSGDHNSGFKRSVQPLSSGQQTPSFSGSPATWSFGVDKFGVSYTSFIRFNLQDESSNAITADTYFTKADLELFSKGTDTDSLTGSIACAPVDGIWENASAYNESTWQKSSDLYFRADDGTTTFITTGGSSLPQHIRLRQYTNGVRYAGQCVTSPASPSHSGVKNMKFSLSKVGSPTGTIQILLYNAKANDGTDDRASGVAINVSNTINASSLTTSPVVYTFTFTGTSTLTDGNRYVFMVNHTTAGSSSNYVRVHFANTQTYNSGSAVVNTDSVAADSAFGYANYSGANDLPHILNQAGNPVAGTNRNSDNFAYDEPIGPIIDYTIPSFSSDNTWYTIGSVKDQLNAWVRHASYPISGSDAPVALALATPSGQSTGAERVWDNARLIVSYRPRNIYVSGS